MNNIAMAAGMGIALGLIAGALVASWFTRRRLQAANIELAVLQSRVKSQDELDEERTRALEHTMQRLQANFDTVAGSSLRANSELFLKLAREHLGQHQQTATAALREREKAIETLVAPIREAINKTEQQIARIEKERAESFGSLKSSIESVTLGQQALQKETRTLVNALRRPEVRGQWGEMTLRRLAELAGMVEHCDFNEQVHVRTPDGNLRPDMIVHMPDGRDLVVDVKTPLDAYLDAVNAADDDVRGIALRRHAQAVAERIRQLAAKSYWAQFEKSPDFVVLFIPGDQFLSAALAEIPTLLEDGIRQSVILATPSSFIALLKVISYGWRQTALAENAETIRSLAQDLHKRLGTFAGHLVRLGRELGQSVDAYNAAVGSLERQVLPGARKFAELGVPVDRELEQVEPIDKLARETGDLFPRTHS